MNKGWIPTLHWKHSKPTTMGREKDVLEWWIVDSVPPTPSLVEVRKHGVFISSSTWSQHRDDQMIKFDSVEEARQALETMVLLNQHPKWGAR